MKHTPEDFLKELLNDEGIQYALFNSGKLLFDASTSLSNMLLTSPDGAILGKKIDDLFPELLGYEGSLSEIQDGSLTELIIERIHRTELWSQEGYVTLKVKAFEDGWLLIVRDVTAEGHLEQKVTQQRNELRLEIAARQRAEDKLGLINEQLENRVLERTVELQEAYARLQTLSQRLVQIQEAERRQIARELHDEIGQALTGIKLLLGMSARNLNDDAKSSFEEAQSLVVDLIGQVRQISLDLRPAMLDDLGLVPALLWHFERYSHQTGVQVDFKHAEVNCRFDPNVETAAYRIIQEGLTNAARYAETDHVQVRLSVYEDILYLRIEDQGVGFDPEFKLAAATSNGLTGMQERAALLGGKLKIVSSPKNGTQIFVEIPVREEAKDL